MAFIERSLKKSIEYYFQPLSLNPNSEWRSYFKDNEVLLQIDKDVRRLYPEMQFFQKKTPFPHKYDLLRLYICDTRKRFFYDSLIT